MGGGKEVTITMQYERRRDRIWKSVLLTVYRHGEVRLKDIDIEVTKKVMSREEAEQLISEKEHRSEEDILENPDGTYTVALEPDASHNTKRALLKTLTSDRYGFLKKSEEEQGVWLPGPLLKVLFSSDDEDIDEGTDVTEEVMDHPLLEQEDKEAVLDTVMRMESDPYMAN